MIYEDTNFELYRTLSDDTLLITTQDLYKKWVDDKLFFAVNPFKQIKYSEKNYAYVVSAKRFIAIPIRVSFESIEKSCNSFNNGAPLSPSLKNQILVFADKLKSWDNYAQPLQVNMQRHGGQHEASEQLLRDLRNKVIDLCNKSQEVLGNMLDRWNNAMKQYNFSIALDIKQQIKRIICGIKLILLVRICG